MRWVFNCYWNETNDSALVFIWVSKSGGWCWLFYIVCLCYRN